MISRYFIDHPRAAWAITLMLTIAGAICLSRMAIAEYPKVTPVTVSISCSYTGASSADLGDSVATIIEDRINSVEDLWYFLSSCDNRGNYNCYCTFRPGTDSNIAMMNVQNAVKAAEGKLPSEVKQSGVSVSKRPEDRLVMYCFLTDGREMDIMELSNFVEKQLADAVQRVEGVGQVSTSGRTYSMRLWLDPNRLAGLGVSIDELKSAIQGQNVQAAAGSVGGEYSNRYLNFKLNVQGRLRSKEEFENIVVRTNPETGAQVLVKDIARVELGCQGYTYRGRFNDNPAVYLEIYKTPDANSVATAERVKAEIERWMARLPKGVEGVLADDSTAFTKVFLNETYFTLFAALGLVILITYVFLQDWRATFVPAVAIPVSLLGAFAFLYPLGYTLNILTMFGLILVIGSLVDDAIVVVENTQALMHREGLSAREAAKKSMGQISGAIIATTLVTLACYLPLAFYSGMVGLMYTQFAVTMCIALCISTFVALVLSPALCATILRPPAERPPRVFAPFNWLLDRFRRGYLGVAGLVVRRGIVTLVLFALVAFLTWFFAKDLPSAFLPKEDRGIIKVSARLSEGQTLDRSIAIVDELHEAFKQIPGIDSVASGCGSSFTWGSGENQMNMTVRLKHWNERKTAETSIDEIQRKLKEISKRFPQAQFSFSQPPAIKGLGGSAGIGLNFCAINGATDQELADAADSFIRELEKSPLVKEVTCGFNCSTPQLELKLDRRKAELLGLTPKAIFTALQNKLASYYVNDFNIKGGVYQVKLQNDIDFRAGVEDIRSIRVPTSNGGSVPVSSVAELRYFGGATSVRRYQKLQAAWIDVTPADGVASGTVMDLIERTPKADGYVVEWGAQALQERESRGQFVYLLAAALIFAYLFLVAQYESWMIPVPVMLSVAFALCGAAAGLRFTGTAFSIYAQLGCVMLIGLAAKNAILMVEFSKQERESGKTVVESALSGADLRFRAVMMTAWSFIFGVIPLVIASGAGAGAMKAIGITTMCGMLAATFVGIVFVPALYAVFQRIRELFK